MKNYTPEQIKDITDRVNKAQNLLKELELVPAAVVQKESLGNDVFADKVIPYLEDLKFKEIVSPLQKNELAEKN